MPAVIIVSHTECCVWTNLHPDFAPWWFTKKGRYGRARLQRELILHNCIRASNYDVFSLRSPTIVATLPATTSFTYRYRDLIFVDCINDLS